MRVCKRGATEHDDEGLVVTACGKARAEKLTDVYYAAEDDKRVVAAKTDESVAFDHELLRNMLVWRGSVDTWSKGTLLEFHKRLGHLTFGAIERLVCDWSSGIELTDHKRACELLNLCSGYADKEHQVSKDMGEHFPIDKGYLSLGTTLTREFITKDHN
ncbi:hypothetical protein F442_02268 [Phytophthora nicotianae P10297]|uniref:Uncharacterized protein n=5 Tax=Phytophthora nicotianae TaxID=4792 RepID=W2QPL2_PHYN3|nr:hypothetical protein PPTG_07129 [Phytophthora nicotianae INRA-310]ETM01299.1 hypothetical protein L917_02098 [Phytophthora nicotianae]ETO83721.1 hypothetical protein F444_02301 [Phytophthora nicotianae P1976]ETP52778.1 hypothetical protein F442_02268 [Phytophthora nicotianae P10297]ETM54480.1 hypothetical protein L914_02193 [Phytophthora nicotianae]ETN14881.1 hypothetical protein PPTG_07129 [Phytophthora nicotianae INRA-310]